MRRSGLLFLCTFCLASPSAAEEAAVIDEVLAILHERGIVDETRYSELVSKNQAYEEKQESLLGRIEFSGDVRARLENFWYDDTALDESRPDRTRGRYRLRLQGAAQINEWTEAIFRVTSGQSEFIGFPVGDRRALDRSFGHDPDFGNDEIFIDLAYIRLNAPRQWIGENGALDLVMGKVKNPFRWRNGRDYLLWDPDITPEGASVHYRLGVSETAELFLNSGYFIVKENSTRKDPHVFGVQAGTEMAASEEVQVGARLSWYSWGSLDEEFFARATLTGAVPDGLSNGAPTSSNDGIQAGELAGYLRFEGVERWPILLYGHYARNFSAQSSDLAPAAGREDTGWGLGVEAGDKREVAKVGLGYYRSEASFWPAQFTDSVLFDGRTNRKGWNLYGSRQILPGTDLNVGLYVSEPLRKSIPDFANSVALADRVRLQTDLVVRF